MHACALLVFDFVDGHPRMYDVCIVCGVDPWPQVSAKVYDWMLVGICMICRSAVRASGLSSNMKRFREGGRGEI